MEKQNPAWEKIDMKIAVTSTGPTLDDTIDPRFGRCAYFVIVEADGMNFEAFDNESIALGGGAGIQSAQFIASKGAEVVITGNCGPNAVQTLSASQIKIFVGQSGTVREAMEKLKRGDLKSTNIPNVADHYGMGGGAGMGRGMGMGRGRGMGRGMRSSARGAEQPEFSPLSKEEALERLKDQEKKLRKEIEELESKMKALEKK